jgi:HSP20 family molecular chaperone IbpA
MSRRTELVKGEPQSLVRSEQRPAVSPACDVYENDDEILVVADLPGVTTDTLAVNLEGVELTVKARRDAAIEGGTPIAAEYSACEFQRRFAVPGGIDSGKISAQLKNGELWLRLPKSEAHKPRQIPVRAG